MKDSKIQWTDHTFNPWIGCTKVSPGCLNCYAEAMDLRFTGGAHWGKGAARRRTSAANWKQPMKWDRESLNAWCAARGQGVSFTEPRRPRVFCASLADWLDDEVPIEWLADLLDLIRRTPHLDWLLLTKRPENWKARLDDILTREAIPEDDDGRPTLSDWILDWYNGKPPSNVWMGTSVEDQTRADQRIPQLLEIPAKVRFLSCEPLLGLVDLAYSAFNGADSLSKIAGIHWVICGGESGRSAREMDKDWARFLYAQCHRAGIAFFMKQMGGQTSHRGGFEDMPEDLRVRERPA